MRLSGVKYLYDNEHKMGINIYGRDGRLLLAKGATLTSRAIAHLVKLGIWEVYIDSPETHDIVVEGAISEFTRRRFLIEVNKEFQKISMSKDKRHININVDVLKRIVKTALRELFANKRNLINLINLKAFDDYTYMHSIDVMIYSLVLGMIIPLPDDKLELLGLGAILYDTGFLLLPKSILEKPDKVTDEEFEILKNHTTLGYDFLESIIELPTVVRNVALSHHERWNGNGYPRGLKGEKIPIFSRIVAISDVYDALVSDRSYREAYLPHIALEYLMSGGGTLFDIKLVRAFIERIAVYPLGTTVKLNTGEVGVVSKVEPGFSSRPTVRILYNDNKEKLNLDSIYEIDLMEKPTILIEKVVKYLNPKDEKIDEKKIEG